MYKHPRRRYQAYADGAKACSQGLPGIAPPYLVDFYLRAQWLNGWDATNAFRQKNLRLKRMRDRER
jgi:hypothetical protein